MSAIRASSYISTMAGICMAAFSFTADNDALAAGTQADDIGSVVTKRNLVTANHTVDVIGIDDPKVDGVRCFVSRAQTGGLAGTFGVAEDTSDASVACRQVGPIKYLEPIEHDEDGEEIFNESRSVFFKQLHVTRLFDEASDTLVYLTWSDKLIDGSPKNAISAVTPMPWGSEMPETPKLMRR